MTRADDCKSKNVNFLTLEFKEKEAAAVRQMKSSSILGYNHNMISDINQIQVLAMLWLIAKQNLLKF